MGIVRRDDLERAVAEDGVLQAGRRLFESSPFAQRPRWAAGVLGACRDGIQEVPGVVLEAEQLALGTPADWSKGHDVFDRLRGTTLVLDKKGHGPGLTPTEAHLHRVVLVAELVAKVTYNAALPVCPFDDDSGWYLLSVALSLVACVKDPSLERAVWHALLDTPPAGSNVIQ